MVPRSRNQVRAETLERDMAAFDMKASGRSNAQIAIALDYRDEAHVSQALSRHMKRLVKPQAEELRLLCDSQLDHIYRTALAVLERTHLKVNGGSVVYYTEDPDKHPDAKAVPLHDSAPVLAAIDRLLRIQESRRKLWGIDAPVQHEVSVSQVTVTVTGAEDV